MDFFLHKLEVIAVCHVYVTQSGLKRPFHVTRDMSSEREFRCSLHVSVSLWEWSQTRTQGTNKQIVDLIIY